MIVRILGEGQWDVPSDAVDGLNALDDQVEQAVEHQDQDSLTLALSGLLAEVRSRGTAVPDDQILDVARRMAEARIRHLPVIDEDKIAGFVSMRDIFEVLIDVASHENDVVVVPSGTRVLVRLEE